MKKIPFYNDFKFPFENIDSPIKKIREYGGKHIFPISWLHTQGYCECKIALWMKGIKPKITEKMIKGKEEHEEREIKDFKPTSKEKVLKDSTDKSIPFCVFRTNLFSLDEQLQGIQDEIVSIPTQKRLIVIEQKPGDKVWWSDKLQAYGYGLVFTDLYEDEFNNEWKNFSLEIAIRSREKFYRYRKECIKNNLIPYPLKFIKYSEKLTPQNFDSVRQSVKRIDNIIKQKMQPLPPQKYPNKCINCNEKDDCPYKLK